MFIRALPDNDACCGLVACLRRSLTFKDKPDQHRVQALSIDDGLAARSSLREELGSKSCSIDPQPHLQEPLPLERTLIAKAQTYPVAFPKPDIEAVLPLDRQGAGVAEREQKVVDV